MVSSDSFDEEDYIRIYTDFLSYLENNT
nr:hypothetical protein [uncultured Flavobacterium sp.]